MLRLHPERAVEWAVTGMLPKTKLGRAMAKKLKVYRGDEHRIRRSGRRCCRRARRS